LAITVCLRARSEAAWALLRPSARLSAKFANSTVNHSHRLIAKMKPAGASPLPRRASSHSRVVMIEPMYTTNITGLRHCWRGSSLRKASSDGRTGQLGIE
jgi:hypothetical protein